MGPIDEASGDAAGDRDGDRPGQEGGPRLDRAVVAHVLKVKGAKEEARVHAGDEQATDDVRVDEAPEPEDSERHDQVLDPRLQREEGRHERDGDGAEAKRWPGAPLFHACRTSLYTAGEPLLKRAQEAGVVRCDVDIAQVIQMVVALAKNPSSEPEEIEHIVRIALDWLRYRP